MRVPEYGYILYLYLYLSVWKCIYKCKCSEKYMYVLMYIKSTFWPERIYRKAYAGGTAIEATV